MATFTNVYIHTFINIPTPGKVNESFAQQKV